MVWAAFGSHDTINVEFSSARMSALTYEDLLTDNLLQFTEKIGGPFRMFQKHIASTQTTNSDWKWFLNTGIQVIPTTAKSPDLNPV